MPHTSLFYRSVVSAIVPTVPLFVRGERDQRAHRARLGAPASMSEWRGAHRDPRRPLAWFHASSAGEGLQARAVVGALRGLRPDLQVVFTHFSPSAEGVARSMQADLTSYLPYDRARDMSAALDALSPDLLVFAKLDLWPELATLAAERGCPVAMVAATVLPDSGRLRWPVRQLVRPGYAALRLAAAVSASDATRLRALGVDASAIRVTGDPRIDSAVAAADAIADDDPLVSIADPAVTLVAGSTWPADEALLLAAFGRVRAEHPTARLIVVPHEPTSAHLAAFDAAVRREGLSPATRLSSLTGAGQPALVVVDRLGVLARLYRNGGVAYVGGGWGSAGIHSVIEPAALCRPVIIGPGDRQSRDAALLAAAGGLVRAPAANTVTWLADEWIGLLQDSVDRQRRGGAARHALEADVGAAERSALLLAELL